MNDVIIHMFEAAKFLQEIEAFNPEMFELNYLNS